MAYYMCLFLKELQQIRGGSVMIWDVKLYVGGKVFTESVHAVNREDALDTAKARNPKAKVIGVNPTLRDKL